MRKHLVEVSRNVDLGQRTAFCEICSTTGVPAASAAAVNASACSMLKTLNAPRPVPDAPAGASTLVPCQGHRCFRARPPSPQVRGSTSHAPWDVHAGHGVHAVYSATTPGTALGPGGRQPVLARNHNPQSPLTRSVRAHTLVGHGKEVVQRMNDFWTCEVTAS
jgi:hypothetical protein